MKLLLYIQDEGGGRCMSLLLEVVHSFLKFGNILDELDRLFIEERFNLRDYEHCGVDHVDELLEVAEQIVVVDKERGHLVGVLHQELLGDEKGLATLAVIGGNCRKERWDWILLIIRGHCLL